MRKDEKRIITNVREWYRKNYADGDDDQAFLNWVYTALTTTQSSTLHHDQTATPETKT